jgi:DNA polymerase-3 subunit delta
MTEPSDQFPPMVAILGADRFLRHEGLGKVLQRLSSAADELGPTRFEGGEADLAQVLDEVRTCSLLGGLRVVIVDDADPFITAHRQALERYAESPSSSGCLILACSKLAKNQRLYKMIAKLNGIVECAAPKPQQLASWLIQRSDSRYGKKLEAPAAQRLRELVGDSPGLLDAELAKLSTYVGDRPSITRDDVAALVGQHREEKVFGIIDAMAMGDAATALALWEQVLATDRAAPGRALAGLAWAVRRLLEVRRDQDAGANLRMLARKLFTDVETAEQRLARVTVASLSAELDDLLAADLSVKTGLSTVATAVEKFIVTHTAAAEVPRRQRAAVG